MTSDSDPFVFVIPVRNPMDAKVKDYRTVQAILQQTVKSVLSQTDYANIQVVIVMHGHPSICISEDPRITLLDVSTAQVFGVDPPSVQIDKGLRYVIGMLYAYQAFRPRFVMPMDADDFVNSEIARYVSSRLQSSSVVDGFLIESGLNIQLTVTDDYHVRYDKAFIVKNFHLSCGSCRIFFADRLFAKISEIDPDIFRRFSTWESGSKGQLIVPADSALWLHRRTRQEDEAAHEIIHLLGRHVRQEPTFSFESLSILGAAKGCGHGNHDGPRAGALHFDKIISEMSIAEFVTRFGLLVSSPDPDTPVWRSANAD